MYRGHRGEQEKQLRRLWTEYSESYSWKNMREHGHWEEVEPYQNGWTRRFTLREDINNRNDARDIRRALDLVNNEVFSRRENFTHYDYKKKEYVPTPQKLGWITEQKHEQLDEKLKSMFILRKWTEKVNYPFHRVIERTAYFVKHDYWFVFEIEPNIITHHWIPDSEFESRRQELQNRFQRDNLWPKINRMNGWSTNDRDYKFNPVYMQNIYGKNLSDADFEYGDE